jgi:hypothetical protein
MIAQGEKPNYKRERDLRQHSEAVGSLVLVTEEAEGRERNSRGNSRDLLEIHQRRHSKRLSILDK